MLRLTIEVPPNPAPFMARPAPDYLAQALANRIGGPVTLTTTDQGGHTIVAALDVISDDRTSPERR